MFGLLQTICLKVVQQMRQRHVLMCLKVGIAGDMCPTFELKPPPLQ